MSKNIYKVVINLLSMLALLAAIITGFKLHKEVWHLHVYDDSFLLGTHETIGLTLLALVAVHCIQHSFWFRNYSKIKVEKKRVTAILLTIGIITAFTGIVLMCGSHSEFISHTHYAGAILFTAITIGHVAKRWKILKAIS
ncbi:MAG: hypothetical protein K2F93_00300 [Muribaculaceae bacterium]|nr:hypothetical protein [Muribaculaceae bacterium]